jgi:hypothetical protein
VFIMDYKDSDLLHLLEDTVRKQVGASQGADFVPRAALLAFHTSSVVHTSR